MMSSETLKQGVPKTSRENVMERMIKSGFKKSSILKYKQETDPVMVMERRQEEKRALSQMKCKKYFKL